jgi:SAM-dependent methyltransferase
VIKLYQNLGFGIAPAEMAETVTRPVTPIEIIREIGGQQDWRKGNLVQTQLAASHISLFEDFPEVPKRIARLYQDPLTNQEGSLTEARNYSTYARGMNEIIRLKYLDIRPTIRSGRIVDEGCADGALLAEISQDFPDADLFGIDLSAEFAGRFQERQRAGEFGGAYVHFFHRNLLDSLFEAESIDTTICNSTLHELWSYARQEKTVRAYLAEKFRQLRPEGRLVIRDVLGPEDGDSMVFLWCSPDDGENPIPAELAAVKPREAEWIDRLSTRARFHLFSHDFLPARKTFKFAETEHAGRPVFRLQLRQAAEFLSKKDYTDNWKSELNEEFCFWSFSQWKSARADTGFQVLENVNDRASGSRAYVNPWIVENRYEGRAAILHADGTKMPWPPTNMVLVAEKPIG